VSKPWIYVSGPYTLGDPVLNVRKAVAVSLRLLDVATPICPHLSHLAHLIEPQPYERWMDWDLQLLERCDALVRLPGESAGADREVARAGELGIVVFEYDDDFWHLFNGWRWVREHCGVEN
jgi:hypothetical protein